MSLEREDLPGETADYDHTSHITEKTGFLDGFSFYYLTALSKRSVSPFISPPQKP